MRTPGSKRRLLVNQGEAVIDRTHFLDKGDRARLHQHSRGGPARRPYVPRQRLVPAWLYDYLRQRRIEATVRERRVLLIQRSPFELYARLGAYEPVALSGLFRNIEIFHRCQQEKCLVYYEDLVSNFDEMGRILTLIGVPYDFSDFDADFHRQRSLELYAQVPGRPLTGGDPQLTSYHARDMRQDEQEALRRFGQEILGEELYACYLGRYDNAPEPHARKHQAAAL